MRKKVYYRKVKRVDWWHVWILLLIILFTFMLPGFIIRGDYWYSVYSLGFLLFSFFALILIAINDDYFIIYEDKKRVELYKR